MARHRGSGASESSKTREQELSVSWEERRTGTERHNTAFVVGALIGGLAGSTAALFRTPQSGHQTREQLASYVGMASQRVTDLSARIGLGAGQGAGSIRTRAAALGSRVRVDLRPATLQASDTAPSEARTVGLTTPTPVVALVDGPGVQDAEPITGLDPSLALTPDLAGTGTATTSVGPEVADEEHVLGHDVPPNMDR